ncbi:SDR family oxidoreductase [Limibacter armeniacum]|uniref:SDR family oxidoreductase n=1 Tax=Limibacter armeniacum TaxID=466084 RepID=UPI002FE5AB8C
MIDIKGKSAIVTGGGSGVGKAITTALVKEGVNVMIASRRKTLLKEIAEELNELEGGKVIYSELDVRSKAECQSVVDKTLEAFGQVDILVNNSGLGVGSLVVDTSEEDWDMVVDTNLKGTFLMSQAVLPNMIKRKTGYILNIASQAAKRGYAQAGAYCASKFGVVGLADALQEEVYEHNILVHSLCPALIQTPEPKSQEELKSDLLQVQHIADTALFVLKQPSTVKLDDIGLYARPTGRTRS